MRQSLFALMMHGSEGTAELESTVAQGPPHDTSYMPGDLFCDQDFAHFLIFGEGKDGGGSVRAGIVYRADLDDARGRLVTFCRQVAEALGVETQTPESTNGVPEDDSWQTRESRRSESFERFASANASESPDMNARGEMVAGWLRAVGMLENLKARRALMRLEEAHKEGRGFDVSVEGEEGEDFNEAVLQRLGEVGLVRREILVSCRKDGRALFRLPSPEAFSTLSASHAVCSECGTALSEEKSEEVVVPTSLTATLLQDGVWSSLHLRSILLWLGVSAQRIAARPVSADGELRMMAEVAGESFLFLLRDGDWTGADVRHAVGEQGGFDASHVVVVAAGKIHDEARQRLREHVRRASSGRRGVEAEVIFVERMDALGPELKEAFGRAVERALVEELWELDSGLGFSAGRLLAAHFRLQRRQQPGPPLGEVATPDATTSEAVALASGLHPVGA
ncbi:MAG: hypothetical protein ACRD9R_07085 [Pyrinomonadaceae bacterium]